MESHLLHQHRVAHEHIKHPSADKPRLRTAPQTRRRHRLPSGRQPIRAMFLVVARPREETRHDTANRAWSAGGWFLTGEHCEDISLVLETHHADNTYQQINQPPGA